MEPMPVDIGRVIFTTSTIQGFWLSDWFRTAAPEQLQSTTTELLRLMAMNEIVPPVEAEYPLSEVLAAVEHSERSGRHGKVLIVD
jgi:NADPH:quinone reductase-like Zn-dependent oxidoreductase